jgi:hypothetical protein
MPEKLDLFKAHKAEYAMPGAPALVTVGPATYLAIDGAGDPNGPAFAEAMGALYGMAWTIKMTKKFGEGVEYKVAPLEGLWWRASGQPIAAGMPADDWRWTALIRTPEFITPADLQRAVAELERKGKAPGAERVRLEQLEEGDCVQVLHVGPYSAETATIAAMHAFAAAQGRELRGRHHEIYLSDPRRVPPERLRTIIRQPVA